MLAFTPLILAVLPLVSAHGIFMKVEGANGKTQPGLGMAGVTTTGHSAFYHAPRFIKTEPTADLICGVNRAKSTATYYKIDWESALAEQVKSGLPSTDGDIVTAKYWQVNTDGAGPFTCEVSTNAKGTSWKTMKVTTQIPGNAKTGKSTEFQQYHTLKAELPSGTKCTGTGGACLVRCKNPNDRAFGGCMAVKKGSSSSKRSRVPKAHQRRSPEEDEEEEELFDEPEFEEVDDEEDVIEFA